MKTGRLDSKSSIGIDLTQLKLLLSDFQHLSRTSMSQPREVKEGRFYALSRTYATTEHPLRARRATGKSNRLFLCCLIFLVLSGCAGHKYLIHRDTPANPLALQLQFTHRSGPQVSDRVATVLRRFALNEEYEENPEVCLEKLQLLVDAESQQEFVVDVSEIVYSISELAYILGKRAEQLDDEARALDMYGVAVSNAYMYLFSTEFDAVRNPYDPQFRGACDLYNGSLEATLRLVNAKGQLKPGHSYELTTGKQTYEVATILRGNWQNRSNLNRQTDV